MNEPTTYKIKNKHRDILIELGAYDQFVKAVREQKTRVISSMCEMSYNPDDIRDVIASFYWTGSDDGYGFWDAIYDKAKLM